MTEHATRTGSQLVSFYQDQPRTLSNSLGVELLPIDRANGFLLPGPAVVGIVYVRHPIDERELIAFADYDEKLAQDRYKETLRVFTKLGAARIVATSRRETLRRASGRLGIRRFGLDVGAGTDAKWSLAFDQEGEGGVPVDPRPLRFSDEPMLDAVCAKAYSTLVSGRAASRSRGLQPWESTENLHSASRSRASSLG
jgi:hypothetical protein